MRDQHGSLAPVMLPVYVLPTAPPCKSSRSKLRQLLAADIAPYVVENQDLSPTVEAAFARVSDLSQYSIEELADVTSWTAHLTPGHGLQDIAQLLQISVSGFQVPEYINNTVIFEQAGQPGAGSNATDVDIAGVLGSSAVVDYFYPLVQQELSTRVSHNDTYFPEQWSLFNYGQTGGTQGVDGNVLSVHEEFTGAGVVIGVVDDAVQGSHPDLAANYRSDLSFDYVDGDQDASPSFFFENHGTAVAGISAAVTDNNLGVAGVAPDAQIAGIRLLGPDGPSDAQTASALTHLTQSIDVSNNSWGVPDEGLLEAAGPLTLAALESGVTDGRGGLGTVYVWAAGNGGDIGEWSTWDGIATNRYNIAVAGYDHRGMEPFYAEPGPNILVAAPTSGGFADGILTTDLTGSDGSNSILGAGDGDAFADLDYTSQFNGTSAAAPFVSGVVALMLEANANLSYRDVQHILVRTSDMIDPTDPSWSINGAGRDVSYDFGFGAINAQAAVDLARVWNNVAPLQTIATGDLLDNGVTIPDADATGITVPFTLADTLADGTDISGISLEHVEVTLDISHAFAGDLEIVLISPDGTESILSRENGTDIGDFANWTFTTVRHWDEGIVGDWSVRIRDLFADDEGTLNSMQVNFYGSEGSPTNLESVANDDGAISGTMFFDADQNGIQGPGEEGLAGRVVFLDTNNNGRFDEAEQSTTTGLNGFYVFTGLEPGDYRVIDFSSSTSVPPGDSEQMVTLSPAEREFNVNFATNSAITNSGPTGSIIGSVFNDLNLDGLQSVDESGVGGMVVYVDLNNNCIAGLGELGVTTAADGSFEISGLETGTYNVRLAPSPGLLQNLPCNGFQVFIAANGQASMSPNFGVTPSNDTGGGEGGGFGDVTHGEVPGFHLGDAINADDGVFFLTGLTPGMTETIGVEASQLSVSSAYLHAWIDYNGDGDWSDSGEQIFSNQLLDDGFNELQIQVPANAMAEMAHIRFRWTLEPNLGPFDPSIAGETEDYVQAIPSDGQSGVVAIDDEATVAEDSADNLVDVLNNDIAGPFSDSFTITNVGTPDQGGSVSIVNGMLSYTPAPDFIGIEKFTYTIADSIGGMSTATVCMTVTNTNDAPMAVDDSYTADADGSGVLLPVLNNDTDIDGDELEIIDVTQPAQGGSVDNHGTGYFLHSHGRLPWH